MKKNKTTSDHSILRGIGKFFATIFVVLFVVLYPLYAVVLSAYATLLNQGYLTTRLTNGVVYQASLEIVKEYIHSQVGDTDSEGADAENGYGVQIDQDLLNAIPVVFPEEQYNIVVTDALAGIFTYLRGDSEVIDFTIDLSGLQAEFPTHLRTVIEKAEPCAADMAPDAILSSEGICRPANVDAFFANPQLQEELNAFVNDQFPSEYTIQGSALPNETREIFENVRQAYGSVRQGVLYGGLIFSALLLFATLLLSRFLHRKIITFGVVLLVPSILLIVASRFATYILDQDDLALPLEDLGELATHIQVVGEFLAEGFIEYVLRIGIVGSLLGSTSIILGVVLRHWKKTQSDPRA